MQTNYNTISCTCTYVKECMYAIYMHVMHMYIPLFAHGHVLHCYFHTEEGVKYLTAINGSGTLSHVSQNKSGYAYNKNYPRQ